jgi:hypothetical protein
MLLVLLFLLLVAAALYIAYLRLIDKHSTANKDWYVAALREPLEPLGPPGKPVTGGAAVAAVEPVSVATAAPRPVPKVCVPRPPVAMELWPRVRSSTAAWVGPDRDVEIAGCTIKGGMLYIGSCLSTVRGGGLEPALIDPSLPTAPSAADCHVRRTNYWPSYGGITPEARASYLQWLAAGKSDPQADIGYVFLYFYGLERRALSDCLQDSQAKADLPAIVQEVRRLLAVYPNPSFHSYAGSLLDYLTARDAPELRVGSAPSLPPTSRQWELSLELRLGLGLHAKAEQPLPFAWAYAWYLSSPAIRRGVALERCPAQFAALFKIEYEKRFRTGLKLPVNKTHLKVTYKPASQSLAGENFTKDLNLPDVSILRGPVAKLREVGDTCSAALASYSRYVGAHPDQAGSREALLLLPVCVCPEGSTGLRLDAARVAALKADSVKVSELLGDVFHESASAESAEPLAEYREEAEPMLLDLDSDHAGLLRALLQRAQWTRGELEELCADWGLMSGGAIERINEAGFSRFDQPLIEGEDPIDINRQLILEERPA